MTTYTTELIEFNGRPTDESVYCYPHRYRIELREVQPHAWQQRHIWFWNDGKTEAEDWIPTPCRPDSAFKRVETVRDICDPAYTPGSYA